MKDKGLLVGGVVIALAILINGFLDRRAVEEELQACIELTQELVGYATLEEATLTCLRRQA